MPFQTQEGFWMFYFFVKNGQPTEIFMPVLFDVRFS